MLSENKAGNSKGLIILALLACAALFVFMVAFVGEGFVRQVTIFWPEDIRTTVAFQDVNGSLRVVGLIGNGGIDPTLVMKAGGTQYILTVINQDTKPHMFSVGGLDMHTKVLQEGENETITLISKKEGTFNYYDGLEPGKTIGQIIAVKVEATD